MTDQEPEGRTFGRGLSPEVELEDLRDRVRKLESQTEFETSEDDDRIKAIERRLNKLEATGDPRYGPLVERINLEVERIDALASKVGWIQEAGASAQRETDRQIAELFNRAGEATRRLDDLARRLSDETTRVNALRAMHHELADKTLLPEPLKSGNSSAWDRSLRMSEQDVWSAGYAEGKKTATNLFRRYNPRAFEDIIAGALEEAASRVKRYMSNHFSEATINAIVLEVKNQSPAVMVPAEDAGVWTGPPSPNIFNEPIMPQVKMPRPMDLNDSSMLSPGPYPTRPIKDNPQG